MSEETETPKSADVAGRLDGLVMLRFINAHESLPPPSAENKTRSMRAINQDGDSVYYSYGYRRWDWWLSVNLEEECAYPRVDSWAVFEQRRKSRAGVASPVD